MLELETEPIDRASGINAILASVRSLKWQPDGTSNEPGRSPAQWARDGVCGFASSHLGGWKITVALCFGVCQRSLWPQKIERWQDGLVTVLPCPPEDAHAEQMTWSGLPKGNLPHDLDYESWDATRALDDDGLRDLQAVIEESVRYLLDAGKLPRAEIATFDAAIAALHEDVCRWAQNASTETDLCRLVHALAVR